MINELAQMMFTTDKQTLEDLNIFGKQGSDSVYAIFNRTTTRGGAWILEEMFRYPLSDDQVINRRSGIIQYFAALGISFPFQRSHVDAVEPYLRNTDERMKLAPEDQSHAETEELYKGVTYLTELLQGMSDFIKSLDERQGSASGHFYQSDKEAISALLAEPGFAPVLKADVKAKLPHVTMAEYDLLFRFRHRTTIQKLLRHIYYLDVYLSVSRVAVERKLVFPTALPRDRHTLHLEGVYHLQLKNAVPNTVRITPEGNVLFLTGANMAGKSTLMKSLGVALLLAHMGFPVAAASMEFSVLDGIHTTINLPDNLGMGASHFYAEVLRVKKVAQELSMGKNLFIIFDELFRGTNVKDAYEATIAITAGFAAKRNSMFVISSHIIEAGDVLRERCPTVNFVYLPTHMNGNIPVYTYTLESGVTADRHGMVIVNNEGILDILKSGNHKRDKTTIA